MPRKKQPPLPPDQQRCTECTKAKPRSAFRWIGPGDVRAAICNACRPALPSPEWRAQEAAARNAREQRVAAGIRRRAERDKIQVRPAEGEGT